jgi:CelD/BcsL family acetyltransferase involved in cellulose biosynthesis
MKARGTNALSSAPATGLSVVTATSLSQLEDRLLEWRHLDVSAEHGEWFAGPDWLLPWFANFANGAVPFVHFVYQEAELVGVVPLLHRLSTTRRLCRPSLETPVNPHVRRVGALARQPLALVYASVFAHLRASGQPLSVSLRQLALDGADDIALRYVLEQQGMLEFSREESAGAIIDLSPGWESYLASLSRDARRGRTRKSKKLQDLGGWHIRMVTDTGGLTEVWPSVLQIESRSWKHPIGTSINRDPGADGFYRQVAERCAAGGSLRLALLEHDGEPVAHALSVARGGVYYALKTSYDESYRDLSTGSVIMWHAIEQAATEGCHTFDFLGDLMEWKSHLVTHTPRYVSRTVFDPGQWGCRAVRFAEQRLKPLGRRLGLATLRQRLRAHSGR